MSQSFDSSEKFGKTSSIRRKKTWWRASLTTLSLAAALGATGIICAAADSSSSSSSTTAPSTQQSPEEFFTSTVKPLLTDKCFACHANGKFKGGLRMDSREDVLKGGKHGPAVVPGKPDASLMIKAVSYTEKLKMPPASKGGKLTDEQIATLKKWIADGAVWDKK